jgi:hypothetical protein
MGVKKVTAKLAKPQTTMLMAVKISQDSTSQAIPKVAVARHRTANSGNVGGEERDGKVGSLHCEAAEEG